MSFAFEKTPSISLTCKLVPVQYREYQYRIFVVVGVVVVVVTLFSFILLHLIYIALFMFLVCLLFCFVLAVSLFLRFMGGVFRVTNCLSDINTSSSEMTIGDGVFNILPHSKFVTLEFGARANREKSETN